jgi:hypothetical protein
MKMEAYNSTMKGLTEDDQKIIDREVEAGTEMFLDKGIKGWNEKNEPHDSPPRLMNEHGLFIAQIQARNEDDFINYRK